MDGNRLQELSDHGRGVAARMLGQPYAAFRPASAQAPMALGNRYLKLPAWFGRQSIPRVPPGWAEGCWVGTFDRAYTRPGDYLQGGGGTFFVAAQDALMPPVCVRTNRTIDLTRSAVSLSAGANGYGGLVRSSTAALLGGWPVCLLVARASGRAPAGLPDDGLSAQYTTLMPTLPQSAAMPQPGDVAFDDLGGSYVVDAAEESALGWRLLMRATRA